MPRSRNVSDDDLSSPYLSEMAGDDDNGTQNAPGGEEQTPSEGAPGPDDTGPDAQPDDDAGGQPASGRPSKKEQTPPQRQARTGDRQPPTREKINLTDAQQRQVYHAIKDRLQPVFNAQNRQMDTLRRENENMKAQLKVYTDRDSAASQYKLTPIQQAQSYQLMAAFLKDPPTTIKYLIDRAAASGHNLAPVLGNGAMSGPSPQAIKDMIAEAVQPLTAEATARQEQHQLRAEAQQQLDDFYSEFPDAQVHEATLNIALQRNPQLSLHRALFELKDYYLRNGMDWSVPLQAYAQAADQQQQQRNPQKPLNTRGNGGAAFDQQDRARANGASREAPPSASFRDIVREQMRLAGFNVNNL